MTNRFRMLITAVVMLAGGSATAQSPNPRKAPPKPRPHGAWWYTGDAPPATPGPPDLTGVWYDGPSGDVSRYAIPGQPLLLTPTASKDTIPSITPKIRIPTACLP